MVTELALTKANRIRLARAFGRSKRVDISIDCVIEGQMGRAVVDDLEHPTAFLILQGPFYYFAGDARSTGARTMVRSLLPYTLLMPSPPEWIEMAKEVHGDKLVRLSRYSFSSERLSIEHLDRLLDQSPFKQSMKRIDAAMAAQVQSDPKSFVDISAFDSAEDFGERGIGFCLLEQETMLGVAYSSLACSKGIEVSIFVLPEQRRRGIATALASMLLKYCLENNIDPHWDAANVESCKLAEKLGYMQTGTYDVYLLRE